MPIAAPESWSNEAVDAFSDAFYDAKPLKLQPVEENTLPSWLWLKRPADNRVVNESSIYQVIERVAASAAYLGWKKGLWQDESEARAFYDDVSYMLTHRMIALEPKDMKLLGVDWAYGTTTHSPSQTKTSHFSATHTITNTAIDAIISGTEPEQRTNWQRFLRGSKEAKPLTLKFADTAQEWGTAGASATQASGDNAPRLAIDLFKFLREDGSLALTVLQHAVRLSVLLLELHYEALSISNDPERKLAIGYVNLSPLLMAMGHPYDSAIARSTAAALSAIITAEAVITSSEIAATFGPCHAFADNREAALRALRNRHRAVYGERNDYEHLSILPSPLDVDDGADLVLLAAARRSWDEAIAEVQNHGLRHLQLTALFNAQVFIPLLDCSSQGIEPERHLVRQQSLGPETFRRVLNPAVAKALRIAKLDVADIKAITDYAVGYHTLVGAPAISHDALRAKGFDGPSLERLESYLPHVSHIRQAFTVWILGDAFCRESLNIDSPDLLDPRFDLLKHIGFSEKDIAVANAFCCGKGTVAGALELPERLAKALDLSLLTPDAMIRMAAAVQSMIMGDVGLTIALPATASMDDRENLFLSAWMQGLKSVTLTFERKFALQGHAHDHAMDKHERRVQQRKLLQRKILQPPVPIPSHKRASLHMKVPAHASKPLAKHKERAHTRAVSLKRSAAKVMQTRVK